MDSSRSKLGVVGEVTVTKKPEKASRITSNSSPRSDPLRAQLPTRAPPPRALSRPSEREDRNDTRRGLTFFASFSSSLCLIHSTDLGYSLKDWENCLAIGNSLKLAPKDNKALHLAKSRSCGSRRRPMSHLPSTSQIDISAY